MNWERGVGSAAVRVLEWIFIAILDFEIWDRNTRRRRRDDPVIAEWRLAQRRAGFALLAWLAAVAIVLMWALFGPSAATQRFGMATLVHWTDHGLVGIVVITTVLTLVRYYQAWWFEPSRVD
jgi:hypothetical protein